ncbi:PREDICTED: integrin beta-1-A-like [Branchiostoma belcheri]|uniref:Integrin beta n=1 Tax=Branchiostoma belcheri TaxID=7741 RepID=A0A6P4Y429_BRABE|nr:PREDICTED: integrin beta-1-A-like [Branchiostoma belcheri]
MGPGQRNSSSYVRLPNAVLCLMLLLTLCLGTLAEGDDVCSKNSPASCGECLLRGPQCAWCAEESYIEGSASRCDIISRLQENGCAASQIQNPSSETVIAQGRPLSSTGSQTGSDVTQVSPQEVRLSLRPGDSAQVQMQVRQVKDYPVDLYYLMDLSKSMDNDLQNLKTLGVNLINKMRNITSNFRVGFGSFVDKTVAPYVNLAPGKLTEPCGGCAPVFGFRNVLSLTDQAEKFSTELAQQQVSGNLDQPEGGFDALMQTAVCNDEIGWREKATKLIVFASDAPFHSAGDGKLGGILTPNDAKCHLDSSGTYTELNNLDYPSVGQLIAVLEERNIQPIFAVTGEQIDIYRGLADMFSGAIAETLAEDSSNVVYLVEDAYKKLRSEVRMQAPNVPEGIELQFTALCLDNQVIEGAAECKNLAVGDTVAFNITVKLAECPQGGGDLQFSLNPVGFGDEMTIKVTTMCSCDCEVDAIPDSDQCSAGNGTLECGVCVCNTGRYGQTCECNADSVEAVDETKCRMDNATAVCSSRGDCLCGQCTCSPRQDPREKVWGKFCECDNFSCLRHDRLICGGRGTCDCGQCVCESGWTGEACECSARTDACIAENGEVCNGHGTCECGKCKCEDNFAGPTCEECPTCPGKCEGNKGCVQCQAFQSGDVADQECLQCPFNVTMVDSVDVVVDDPEIQLCRFRDDDDCLFTFSYGKGDDNTLVVNVQRTKECPPDVNILPIILGIVAGIVLIGLALLIIWRVLIYLYDRNEYQRFEREQQKTKFSSDINPLYRETTTKFLNPTYGGNK